MTTLYVLECCNSKYYVGTTKNLDQRLAEHYGGVGSAWTSLHQPVRLVTSKAVKSIHDENNTTKDLMSQYGVHNVRGGAYSQVILPREQVALLQREIQSSGGACYTCGNQGHIASKCEVLVRRPSHFIRGRIFPRKSCYSCFRCGKRFLDVSKLYTHRDRYCK